MIFRRTALGTLAVVVALTAGCGGGAQRSRGAPTEAERRPGPTLLGAPGEADRKVVYTADLDVRVPSAGKAGTRAIEETKRAGGYLFAQKEEESTRTTELTLKVPSDRFDTLLDTIAGLGHVLRRSIKAQDVTAEVVDTEGRLKTAQARSLP